MIVRPRLSPWLALALLASCLGASTPAHAARVISAKSTKFQMDFEAEERCICAPESLLTKDCAADFCDLEALSQLRWEDDLELVYQGILETEGDPLMQVTVMMVDGGYDPDEPIEATAWAFIKGYTESAGLEPHGVDDPQSRFDLGQHGDIHFARFAANVEDSRQTVHVMFGKYAFALIIIVTESGHDEAMSALGHDLVQGVQMPTHPPRQDERIMKWLYGLMPVLVIVGLLVWFINRKRKHE